MTLVNVSELFSDFNVTEKKELVYSDRNIIILRDIMNGLNESLECGQQFSARKKKRVT